MKSPGKVSEKWNLHCFLPGFLTSIQKNSMFSSFIFFLDIKICRSDSLIIDSKLVFEKSIKFDKINTQALPVLVYELNTKAVAWYDIEMFMGHA